MFIKERDQEVASTSEAATITSGQLLSRSNLQLAIDKCECEPRVNSRLSVLQYWRSKRFVYPELFRLSKIVLAAPMRQVSVERTFSGLKFVLSDLRCALHSDVLEDIMLIRCNALFKK